MVISSLIFVPCCRGVGGPLLWRCMADLIGDLKNERGRKLLSHELVPRTVVLLHKVGRNHIASMWVESVEPELVTFYAGVTQTVLILFRQPDGTVQDDTGTEIEMYEYLGEI